LEKKFEPVGGGAAAPPLPFESATAVLVYLCRIRSREFARTLKFSKYVAESIKLAESDTSYFHGTAEKTGRKRWSLETTARKLLA